MPASIGVARSAERRHRGAGEQRLRPAADRQLADLHDRTDVTPAAEAYSSARLRALLIASARAVTHHGFDIVDEERHSANGDVIAGRTCSGIDQRSCLGDVPNDRP